MPLSANLGIMLRKKFDEAGNKSHTSKEIEVLQPLFELQEYLSHIPRQRELLIEHIETKDGFHLFVFPFEGRLVHEAMAAILAYRISQITPITFSLAMNDYSFELLSDQDIPIEAALEQGLFSPERLSADVRKSINTTEMARRKFRDIASIAGLVFSAADFVGNSVDWMIVRAPDSADDHGVGPSLGFLG